MDVCGTYSKSIGKNKQKLTAEDCECERARLGRVLVFLVHFFFANIRSGQDMEDIIS